MKLISMQPQFKAPLYVIWEITRRCNFKCNYCNIDRTNHNFIKYESLMKVIKHLSNSKYEFDIDLMGGEPTIHPNYLDLLESLLICIPTANIYTTTNTSRSLSFFKSVHNKLKNYDRSKIRFYFSYHTEFVKLSEYVKKLTYLTDLGYQVYIKYVCNNSDIHRMKYVYSELKKTNYSKLFVKYLWNYRNNDLYNKEVIEWIEQHTEHNNYIFDLEFEDDDHTIHRVSGDYNKIKKYDFDVLTDYYCYVNRLLFIDIFGHVNPSCLKYFNPKPILNAYIQSIDLALDKSLELKQCKQTECTELFNNPYKYIKGLI